MIYAKRFTRSSRIVRIVFFLCFVFSVIHNSDGQSTKASIAGKVTDESGGSMPGATIMLKNESTGFETGTVSDIEGKYLFNQLPLGGPYTVQVSFVGYGTQQKSGYYISQSQRIVVDANLSSESMEMDEVVITSEGIQSRIQELGQGTSINELQIKKLPTEGRNFTRLVSLSPLQGGGSINLGGQRRTSTNITIDGANARNTLTAGEIGRGPYTISQEAIREFEVSTNDYDVTQGRQGGGAINAVTKSGTNEFEGSAFFFHRADALQSDFNIEGERRQEDFFTSQYGFSFGGPIIKNKLHFYTVYERQEEEIPIEILNITDQDDQVDLEITADTLAEFIRVARELYGVSDQQQVGEFTRETEANTWFARLDWQINDKHRLTVRNNWNKWENPFSVGDNNPSLAETRGDFNSMENSTLISLRSAFSNKFTNEFKVQYQYAERSFQPNSQLPGSNIPRAVVDISSQFVRTDNNGDIILVENPETGELEPDTVSLRDNFQIGGQRFSPEDNVERQIHLTNTSYLNLGKFNVTFGTDNMITMLETLLSNEQNGRFDFASLDDFRNLNPEQYRREVPLQGLPLVEQTVVDISLFGQVEFEALPFLQVMAGLRYDATAFLDDAQFNPTVFSELGIRTNRKPQDWDNVQPRLQLTYNLGGRNKNIIKLGGGFFTAQPHYYAQVNNIQNSGELLGAIDLQNEDVPIPDFVSYRNDPSTVPGVELFEELGITPFSTINAVSDDFEVPIIKKMNLGYTHFINERYSLSFEALASFTRNNYVYQESNLVEEPFFTTGNEGREVFVPADEIGGNGFSTFLDGRISDEVGRALVLTDDGKLDQWAVIISGSARLGRDGYLDASFTYNEARDNSSYNCCVANTSTFLPVEGDPRALNYGFSDNNFNTKLVVNGATPSWKGLSLGVTVTGDGGSRYTFRTGRRSTNGDFNSGNDVAFVFDPNDSNTPQNIIDGYNDILNDPEVPSHFKEYLRESFGGFAERGGGRNPFAATVDARLIYNLRIPNSKHSIEFTADVFNFANLLNRDWGNTNNFRRGQTLQNVTNFDSESESFVYQVRDSDSFHESNVVGGTPWRLQLGARYRFGR
ncbi:MAG: carboxypeptidase regulatory-like domain-containing protein [Bacteroidota bacterium]